jgi:hypothetical protein
MGIDIVDQNQRGLYVQTEDGKTVQLDMVDYDQYQLNKVIGVLNSRISTLESAAAVLYWRTLTLFNLATGTDIADPVNVQADGVGTFVVGVLHQTIASNLVVQINLNGKLICQATIPSATPINTPVVFSYANNQQNFIYNQIFTANITASDGSTGANGVCSFTCIWVPSPQTSTTTVA